MPKYRKKGQLRETCSNQCRRLLHPTTSEQARKAGRTRFANHVYKSHQNDVARGKVEYRQWRESVFHRDNYICRDCGRHNHKGAGNTIQLHPHHLESFANNPKLRYEVANGLTLCSDCHRKRHKHVFIGRARKRVPGQLTLPTAE